MCRKICIFFILVLFITSCKNPSETDNSNITLIKIDDFPLYEMYYNGDYGFSEFLQTGLTATTDYLPADLKDKWGCTCFQTRLQDGSVVLGRNFDWYDHPALILFTDPPDGYAAASMVDISYLGYGKNDPVSSDDPQLHNAPFLPFDGMNEKGLAIGIMAVPYAHLYTDPQKITLGSLQIIRLLLDYARNLDEAISLMQEYNIDFEGGPPLHYFIVDSSGSSAVIEFVDNQFVILRNEDSWQVSTNFIISMTDFDDANSPCWRYNLAYSLLEQNRQDFTTSQSMNILSAVSQSNTIWSALYNLKSSKIQIVMGRNYSTVYNWESGIRN